MPVGLPIQRLLDARAKLPGLISIKSSATHPERRDTQIMDPGFYADPLGVYA